MKNRILLPCIVAAIAAMISIAGLFLPYIGSTPEYADYLNSVSNQKPFDTADITAATSVDLSLYEYAKTYWQGSDEIFGSKAEGIFYVILFVSPGIFGFFALLCALRKKGIPLILQSLIIGGLFFLINWDSFEECTSLKNLKFGKNLEFISYQKRFHICAISHPASEYLYTCARPCIPLP